jgi:hypothetical protein
MNQKTIKYLTGILLFALTLILIWPAVYNGFPLVYSDSGTYINSGYYNDIPVDRPIIYCLFVRYLSLSQSLWFVVITQAILVSFVIYTVTRKFTSGNTILISTLIISILSFTTGIANYTSQIMPDIFSALAIIGFAVILTTEKMRWKEYFLSLIIIISAVTNFSNLILLSGILLMALLFLLFRLIKPLAFMRGVIIAVLSFILIISVNKSLTGKYQISQTRNVFIIARMIETGIVKNYLIENCGKNDFILCDQIDSLPASSSQFLWSGDSPLYKGDCAQNGWGECWKLKSFEYGKIVNGILASPYYDGQLFLIYSKDFFKQLALFNIGTLVPMGDNSSPQRCIKSRFPNDLPAYTAAKQYENEQGFKTLSAIQLATVILSLLIIILMLVFYRKLNIKKEHIVLSSFLVLGIIGNALTVTIFSVVLDRYQSRVIWILPFISLLFIYHYLIAGNENKSPK